MRCVACQSDRQNDFPSEIALRFSGREDLEKQHVFLYPKVVVCLDCGWSGFAVTEAELL
jgi:hypothetical protein